MIRACREISAIYIWKIKDVIQVPSEFKDQNTKSSQHLFKSIVLRFQNKTKQLQNNSKNHQALPSPLKKHCEAGKCHNYIDSFSPYDQLRVNTRQTEFNASWIQNPASCVPEWPPTQFTVFTSAEHYTAFREH